MSQKPVLVVEDDADIRKQVAQALELEGYPVYEASNGQEALNLLKGLPMQKLPGCMLVDIMMPVMDGSEFLDSIDRDYKNEFGNIPVIVATAKGSPTNPVAFSRCAGKIHKPFTLDELYSGVAKFCNSSTL